MTRKTKGYKAEPARLSPAFTIAITLSIIFGISLFIRVYLPYDLVFAGDWVRFRDTDPWWYMRQVDNLVHNFPHRISFDPYFGYPYGGGTAAHSGWLWLLASIAWAIGLGTPSEKIIDLVGAYLPAILGALTVVPVYFIGKVVFNHWAGLLGAALISVLPGTFLSRTLLGMPDHHVAEIFFSTLTMMFLILAIKQARGNQLSFSHLLPQNWKSVTKPLACTLLAGISLGIYLLSWAGALLFVFIIFCFLIVQPIIDHLRRTPTDYLGIIGGLTFVIASGLVFGFYPQVRTQPLYQVSLLIALTIPIALCLISRLMADKGIKPAFYPLIVAGLGLSGIILFYIINPHLLRTILGYLSLLTFAMAPGVSETIPLLFTGGYFSLNLAWANFTTGFFITFVSLGLLIYEAGKRGEATKMLLLTWSLIIVALGLGMLRWSYYLAIIVALLTGYFAWKILKFAGFKEPALEPKVPQTLKKKGKVKPKKSRPTFIINQALALIIVFFLVFFPNLMAGPKQVKAGWAEGGATICEDLYRSLIWLKNNTPEPFPDPDFYYQLYEPPPKGQQYSYPPSAYSVMSLWGYGYFIVRIAHRLPVADPGGMGPGGIPSAFFTAQDEASANKIMDGSGAKYVIVDHTVTAKFPSLAALSGKELSQFMDVYYTRKPDSTLTPTRLYFPDYYKSLASQLYNFNGEASTPTSITVISYAEMKDKRGRPYKEITSSRTFATYPEAEAFIGKQAAKNYRIVGTSPGRTPVPLEGLQRYKFLYESPTLTLIGPGIIAPRVKIFEYIK